MLTRLIKYHCLEVAIIYNAQWVIPVAQSLFRSFQFRQEIYTCEAEERKKKKEEETTRSDRVQTYSYRRPYLTIKVYRVNDLAYMRAGSTSP